MRAQKAYITHLDRNAKPGQPTPQTSPKKTPWVPKGQNEGNNENVNHTKDGDKPAVTLESIAVAKMVVIRKKTSQSTEQNVGSLIKIKEEPEEGHSL